MTKNHFFIIGAQRCGTTYLYKILDEHPEICMAKPLWPEPKFFLTVGINDLKKDVLNEYKRNYFYHCEKEIVYGEKSTSYIEYINVANKIKIAFPKAIIFVLLRNPVYRALSNYYFSKSNGLETRTLEEVFIERRKLNEYKKYNVESSTSVSPYKYLDRGKYVDYIDMWNNYFDRKSIFPVIFEKLVNNINEVNRIYRSLGVSDYTPKTLSDHPNASNYKKEEVPKCVIENLYKFFNGYNFRLKKEWNIDISIWEKEKNK